MRVVVIEDADTNTWGVSLTSNNPEPKDYFRCESEERAWALQRLLERIPQPAAPSQGREGFFGFPQAETPEEETITRAGPETPGGAKVRFVGASDEQVSWGNNDDPRLVCKIGEVYEVESVEVHSWHTKIRLVGIKGRFNSVSFVSVPLLTRFKKRCEGDDVCPNCNGGCGH